MARKAGLYIDDKGTGVVVVSVIIKRDKADERDQNFTPKKDGEGEMVLKDGEPVMEHQPISPAERQRWYLSIAEEEVRNGRSAVACGSLIEAEAAEKEQVTERFKKQKDALPKLNAPK